MRCVQPVICPNLSSASRPKICNTQKRSMAHTDNLHVLTSCTILTKEAVHFTLSLGRGGIAPHKVEGEAKAVIVHVHITRSVKGSMRDKREYVHRRGRFNDAMHARRSSRCSVALGMPTVLAHITRPRALHRRGNRRSCGRQSPLAASTQIRS